MQNIAEIMRGKKVEFSSITFQKLVEIVAPKYLQSEDLKQISLTHLTYKSIIL